jgi:hypothetical protein
MGASIKQERQVASKILQNMSEMAIYMAEDVCQYISMRDEYVPFIITINVLGKY